MDGLVHFAVLHEVAHSLYATCHDLVVLGLVTDNECRTGHSDELVACTYLEPGIAGDDVVLAIALDDVAGGRDLEAVEETVACGAELHLACEECLQSIRLDGGDASREDYTLALLDREFEIAGHEEIFLVAVATNLLTRIFDTNVPVGMTVPLVLLR